MSLREAAKKAGKLHYYTGKSCKYGHLSQRFVSTGGCCQCMWERQSRGDGKKWVRVYIHRDDHKKLLEFANELNKNRDI